MHLIDKIPLWLLVLAAALMLGAPFSPEPHLVEKARMALVGTLTRPIDLFDVFWHLLPAMLLVIRIVRVRASKTRPPERVESDHA